MRPQSRRSADGGVKLGPGNLRPLLVVAALLVAPATLVVVHRDYRAAADMTAIIVGTVVVMWVASPAPDGVCVTDGEEPDRSEASGVRPSQTPTARTMRCTGPGPSGERSCGIPPIFDIVVDSSGVQVVRTTGTRKIARLHGRTIRWDQLAAVDADNPVWSIDGRLTLLPMSPVTFVLVGELVDDLHRAFTDAGASAEGLSAQERAEIDAEVLEADREVHGDDHVFGTLLTTLYVQDGESLVEFARPQCRGEFHT